jgi:hypothetical protein
LRRARKLDGQLSGWNGANGALAGDNDDFCGLRPEISYIGIGTNN